MATVNITNRFLNENKRYTEAVVVTIPAVLNEGGGRTQNAPAFLQGGDSLAAQVIETDTLITKAYLNITEAFPAGALIAVDVAGTTYFTSIDGTATGVTVSTIEDSYLANKQTVTTVVSGITGDVTTGKLTIIFDTIHASLNNGQYAN